MSTRFDYVKYDEIAATQQLGAKNLMIGLEEYVEAQLHPGRAKALVLTKLEEVYMWMGKAIRDDQIARNGVAELQESRGKMGAG